MIHPSVITTGSLHAHGDLTGYARVYLYGFGWELLGSLGGPRGGFCRVFGKRVKRNRTCRGIDRTYGF